MDIQIPYSINLTYYFLQLYYYFTKENRKSWKNL